MESSRVNVFHKYNCAPPHCKRYCTQVIDVVHKMLYKVIKNPINAHHTSKD